jgi:hypothetical protein
MMKVKNKFILGLGGVISVLVSTITLATGCGATYVDATNQMALLMKDSGLLTLDKNVDHSEKYDVFSKSYTGSSGLIFDMENYISLIMCQMKQGRDVNPSTTSIIFSIDATSNHPELVAPANFDNQPLALTRDVTYIDHTLVVDLNASNY